MCLEDRLNCRKNVSDPHRRDCVAPNEVLDKMAKKPRRIFEFRVI